MHGLLRASFIPPIEQRDLRDLIRHRTNFFLCFSFAGIFSSQVGTNKTNYVTKCKMSKTFAIASLRFAPFAMT
jgi:hypothetical protein